MRVNPEEDIVIRGCFGGWDGPPATVDLSKVPSVESADYGKPPVGSTPGDLEFRSWFDSMMGRCRATLYQGENYVPGSVQWGAGFRTGVAVQNDGTVAHLFRSDAVLFTWWVL